MEIEVRQGRARGNDLIGPGQTVQHRQQGRLHLEDDPCPPSRHLRGVAAELKRVTQTLLRMKEHGLATNVLNARPLRLGKVTPRRAEVLALPARFVQWPAALEISGEQQGERLVPACLRQCGIRTQRLVIARERFGRAIQRHPCNASIRVGFCIGRLDEERTLVTGKCLREPIQFHQGKATAETRIGKVRLDLQRSLVAGERIIGAVRFTEGIPAIRMRLCVFRTDRDRPIEARHRFIPSLQCPQRVTPAQVRLCMTGPEPDHPIETEYSLIGPLQIHQRHTLVEAGIDTVRVDLDGACKAEHGLFAAPQGPQRHAATRPGLCVARAKCDGAIVTFERFTGSSQLLQGQTQVLVRLGAIRIRCKRAADP